MIDPSHFSDDYICRWISKETKPLQDGSDPTQMIADVKTRGNE
jgi:hypothetical protein